jgi:hypothetical protein
MRKTERWTNWTGVAAVVLWVIGAVVGSTGAPSESASEAEWLAHVETHATSILAGGWIWMAGWVAFLWFAIVLRERLAAAEGGSRTFANAAFLGSALVGAFMMLTPGGEIAAAITAEEQEISASAVAALRLVGEAFISAATLAATLLMLASGAVVLRSRILPKAWAWLSFALAGVLLIPPVGWAALLLGLPLWVIATTALLQRPGATPVPATT